MEQTSELDHMIRLPHAIPYQGSKRSLAPLIGAYVPQKVERFYEPFAGSGAMTIYAAHHGLAKQFVLADSLEPIVSLWRAIVFQPGKVANDYRALWEGQGDDDSGYFNRIRERYNSDRAPVDLLYLICRCVKNAVRFNVKGNFTQSVDKRRLGMRPERMEGAVKSISSILKGRVEFRSGDWLATTVDAGPKDFIYMDPPYLGTSIGRDKRYHAQLTQEAVIDGLESMIDRDLRFALSYDGMTGGKSYGPPLPTTLGLTRLLLHAGLSSQATLAGRREETVESLYISPGLAEPVAGIIRRHHSQQALLFA